VSCVESVLAADEVYASDEAARSSRQISIGPATPAPLGTCVLTRMREVRWQQCSPVEESWCFVSSCECKRVGGWTHRRESQARVSSRAGARVGGGVQATWWNGIMWMLGVLMEMGAGV
jgi:hypothetical protein